MDTRNTSLAQLETTEFDIIVIGGGIAGAGVAQNAASRGLKVALIEREDFAFGTSSRTTKLIHGGLRYLEQFNFALTRQLCQERALLEKLAPHLVRDFSFVMPLPRQSAFFALKATVGMALYDFLALTSATPHHYDRLTPGQVIECAPALYGADISGGLRFHDCITDDARIVLAVIKSACASGAVVANYLEAAAFEREGAGDKNKIRAVICHDRIGGNDLRIRAKCVINATGVWSDQVAKLSEAGWHARIKPSKGIHIIVPPSTFETTTALFLPTGDERYVFVVPWQRSLMIGTTDTPYTGELERPLPAADEIDYLLQVVNTYTKTHKLNRSDVKATFAGLRPLVATPHASNGTGPSETHSMSREHMIFETSGGLISVAGGKLTSFRLMAEEVMERAAKRLDHDGIKLGASHTGQMMLGGWRNHHDFLERSTAIAAHARRIGIEPATIDHLLANYGADAQAVVELVGAQPDLAARICPDFPPIMAEVAFGATCEMAVCLEDVLLRRMRLGILNHKQCLEAAPAVATFMQKLLGWDRKRRDLELKTLDGHLGQHIEPLAQAVAGGA